MAIDEKEILKIREEKINKIREELKRAGISYYESDLKDLKYFSTQVIEEVYLSVCSEIEKYFSGGLPEIPKLTLHVVRTLNNDIIPEKIRIIPKSEKTYRWI